MVREFIERYEETKDMDFLQIIARSNELLSKEDLLFLLDNLSEEYWRARVIQNTIVQNRQFA